MVKLPRFMKLVLSRENSHGKWEILISAVARRLLSFLIPPASPYTYRYGFLVLLSFCVGLCADSDGFRCSLRCSHMYSLVGFGDHCAPSLVFPLPYRFVLRFCDGKKFTVPAIWVCCISPGHHDELQKQGLTLDWVLFAPAMYSVLQQIGTVGKEMQRVLLKSCMATSTHI